MKIRNLIILLIAAGILGIWAYKSSQDGQSKLRPGRVGEEIFKTLPLNDVAAILITTPQTNVTIKRTAENWVVAERYDYPAKFQKIVDTLLALRDLKIGQVIAGGSERAADFRLETSAEDEELIATRLELRDASDKVLAELSIGKHFTTQPSSRQKQNFMFGGGGYPSGQYVKLADGTIAVVSSTLDNYIEPATSWLADDFLNVPTADIEEISLTGPERAPVKVIRESEAKTFTLEDFDKAEGTLDTGKLGQLAGGLSYLSFQDVADPSLTEAETGLDQPIVYTARAKDGCIYTLSIGKPVSENVEDRYVRVSLTYEQPPEKTAETEKTEDAEEAKTPEPSALPPQFMAETKTKTDAETEPKVKIAELNRRHADWVYIVRSYRAENLLLTRDQLIEPKAEADEPPADSEPATGGQTAETPAAAENTD